ncbi:ATP-binding protein [Streptomyces sp. NPDC058576]|uniref:ATP-binding protein n=1 Tax=Streptomyces sp. NPDC058576 TaxID=3346547 RepID=UPI003650A922
MSNAAPVRRTAVASDPVGAAARTPGSAAEARDAVAELLASEFCSLAGESQSDVVVADALLITSELVTNAVRHGGGLTGFSARITEKGLRITVDDADPGFPVVREQRGAQLGEGGYGWPLVRRLASEVSVTPHGEGKRIVAVVALF